MLKKLLLLLATVEIIFTACEGGESVEEENGGTPSIPKIELSQQSIEVDFELAQHSVSVTSPYSWKATSKNDWIVVDTKSGIAGTKELKFSVKRNEELEIREGTIVIKNEDYNLVAELYVTQTAFVSAITIEPESLTFAAEGGTQEVAVTANFEYEFSTRANWLIIKKSEKGIMVTAQNYAEVKERTAEIIISSEKYGVSKVVKATQGAFVSAITIEPESLTFAAEGSTQEVVITANFEYEFSTNADWLTIKKSENGVMVNAKVNASFEKRTTDITISGEKYGISKNISVAQKGISVESQNIILYTSSDGKKVEVYTPNFRENIVSNTYHNGQGVIIFDAPVTRIGNWAFDNRDSLTSITIPNSVTTIGSGAFAGCDSLTSITIPDSVTTIGNVAFSRCTSLTSITIGNSVTSIVDGAFSGCTSLTSITIPDSVTSIGQQAFSGCTSLTNITIPDSVTSIRGDTFYNCTSLTSVTIGNGVTSIGESAFYNCTSLTSVTIGNGVTSIGESAFYNCTSLTSITIPDSVTSIGNYAFSGCTSLTSVTIGNRVTSIGNSAFSGCTSLTSVTIGNSVIKIGDRAFYCCDSLTSVTIGNSVTSIGNSAFYYCTSLTSVTIPDSVTSIGESAFEGCTSLTSVTIPDSVTTIGDSAFYYCTSLTSVVIGNSVTSIGGWAFSSCYSLKEVYCKPTTPPTGGYNMFYDNASGRKIYVPRNSVSAYKAKQYWIDHASCIVGYDF